jgi:antitoxin component of RelBE/YafQ-DinJ toxin-antitoxin module
LENTVPQFGMPIDKRLNIEPKQWIKASQNFEKQFKHFAGNESKVKNLLKKYNQKSCHGMKNCQIIFT